MNRLVFLFFSLLLISNVHSQNEQAINITTTGTGLTKNNAINDALRNALEQTYGGFISSKTNITNDELFNDEVVAITSGEIHDYELVSETKIESYYAVTIVAKISQTGLNNFVTQSGGDAVIFDANVFSTKIKLQRLNEKAEIKSINNILEILEEIYKRSIEFEFTSSNPRINENNRKWRVDFTVSTKYNENILNFIDYFSSSLEKIAMTKSQKAEYQDLGKSTYPVLVNNEYFYFRNEESYNSINNFLVRLKNKFGQFKIMMNNGDYIFSPSINSRTLSNYNENFFIPYLNHTPDRRYSRNNYYNYKSYVGFGSNGEFRHYRTYNKGINYQYILVEPEGIKGKSMSYSSRYGLPVPKNENESGILMLNKENKIKISPNPNFESNSIWIGEIKGDGGLIFPDGETLFMSNQSLLSFSFIPNNLDTIFVDGKESSIDEYLSEFNNEGTFFSRTFTGSISDNKRWANNRKTVDVNKLNLSKKKRKRIQKRIDSQLNKLDKEQIKSRIQNLITNISTNTNIDINPYNDSVDENHFSTYSFYVELTEDQIFSNTGYKLINELK